MKKFAMFAMLLAVSVLVGCNQTPAEKKAADMKKVDNAIDNAADAIDKGEMKKEKIDENTAATVEKDEEKAEKALDDAAEQDAK
jgi:outer membrane murein-binding lipoprotein Lpp